MIILGPSTSADNPPHCGPQTIPPGTSTKNTPAISHTSKGRPQTTPAADHPHPLALAHLFRPQKRSRESPKDRHNRQRSRTPSLHNSPLTRPQNRAPFSYLKSGLQPAARKGRQRSTPANPSQTSATTLKPSEPASALARLQRTAPQARRDGENGSGRGEGRGDGVSGTEAPQRCAGKHGPGRCMARIGVSASSAGDPLQTWTAPQGPRAASAGNPLQSLQHDHTPNGLRSPNPAESLPAMVERSAGNPLQAADPWRRWPWTAAGRAQPRRWQGPGTGGKGGMSGRARQKKL